MKNLIAKLTRSGAITAWQKHFAAIDAEVRNNDTAITAFFEAAVRKDKEAIDRLQKIPSVDAAVAAVAASANKAAATAVYDVYRSGPGANIGDRIDEMLDCELLAAAIAEARAELKQAQIAAIDNATAFADNSGTDKAEAIRAVGRTYGDKLAALDAAENMVENNRKSRKLGQPFLPRSLYAANNAFVRALAA